MPVSRITETEREKARQLMDWLKTFSLPTRLKNTLFRPLDGIINRADDSYYIVSGVFGMTARDFIQELHREQGGTLQVIRSLGPAGVEKLRDILPSPGSHLIPDFKPIPVDMVMTQRTIELPSHVDELIGKIEPDVRLAYQAVILLGLLHVGVDRGTLSTEIDAVIDRKELSKRLASRLRDYVSTPNEEEEKS